MSCVNKNHPEIKTLASRFGFSNSYTAAAVGVWQQLNNTELYPTYGELKELVDEAYKNIDNANNNAHIKKGIEEIFNERPELKIIGTPQEYSNYLETIFPNSKVKDIVYHGTNDEFNEFLEDNLNYFGTKDIAEGYGKLIHPAVINISNPYYEDGGNLSNQSYEDLFNKLDESGSDGFISNNKVLFVPKTSEQIHILGNKEDIDGFKEYVDNNIGKVQLPEDTTSDTSKFDKTVGGVIANRLAELYPNIEVLYSETPIEFDGSPTTLLQLSNKLKGEFISVLTKKRPDLVELGSVNTVVSDVEEFIDKSIENKKILEKDKSKLTKVLLHWIVNGYVNIQTDGEIVLQSFKIGNIKNLNLFNYNTPQEVQKLFPGVIIKRKIDFDTIPTLTNKKELDYGVVVYDVENSAKGQKDVRDIMDNQWGIDRNCWCLLERDENGITDDAISYWNNRYPGEKKIAFQNGKIVAFYGGGNWWDEVDKQLNGIPIKIKLNDELNRSAFIIIDENGKQIDVDVIFKGNKRNGEYKEWYENGQFKIEANYVSGKLNGEYKKWYENGKLEIEANYANGELNGENKVWWENGKLSEENNYKNGKKNGKDKAWYKNGQLMVEVNYVNGKMNGEYKGWHENGKLRYYGNYVNGELNGEHKEWYENGQLMVEVNYVNDKRNGEYKVWYESGQLMKEVNYENGEQNGENKVWWENGKLSEENNYKNGELNGEHKEWYKNGQLMVEVNYVNGKMNGEYKGWYKNGQLMKEVNYENGEQNGKYKAWYESGKLWQEVNYEDGERNGEYKVWYENGKLSEEGNFVDGELQGEYKAWDENGQLKEEGNYENDEEFGEEPDVELDDDFELDDDLIILPQIKNDKILGLANLEAYNVLIDAVNQRKDTLPHEYAHHYIRWYINSPIVQEGIKRFGSEEQLVQAIGEQAARQQGEAYNWWKRFTKWLLDLLSDKEIVQILTDSFLQNYNLNEFRYGRLSNNTSNKTINKYNLQPTIQINNIKKKGLAQQIVLDLIDKIQNAIPGVRVSFTTLNGKVAQRIGGTLYFDLEKVSNDTAMHEFGHLWLDIMEETEPEQFAIIEREVRTLLKNNPTLDDEMHKMYPDIDGVKYIKEVAAHAIGLRTENRVVTFVKSKKLDNSLISYINEFITKISDLFKSVMKRFFGTNTNIDLGDTLNTVFDKIAEDLIEGNKMFQNDIELNKDLMEYMNEDNIDDQRIGNMREFFVSLASNKGNRFEKGFYSDAKLAELILKGNSIQKNTKYPQKGAFVYQDRFINVYLDTKDKNEIIRKVIPKYRLMEQEFKEGICNTLNEYLEVGNNKTITQIGMTYFKDLKNDLRQTAFDELLEQLHLDGSVERVMRYSDLRNSTELWQRELFHRDLVGDDPIIFIHNANGNQKTISVVNITMQPFASGFNTKYLQRNIFRKFPGPKDAAVSKLGVTLRDTDGDIMLLGSLMTAKYAMMKDSNIRIKSVGVVGFAKKEVESHYSIEILNDFKNIDAIKEFKELYDSIESTEITKVIDFKNTKQSVTTEMDKLIQFYENGGYTEGSNHQITESDIEILKLGSMADKQNVIKKRISILNDNIKPEEREKSQEYRLLSMADFGINTVSMADRNEISNISKLSAYFHTPVAVNSDVFQMVHKAIIKANGMIINETMKWHNVSKKLVTPIINKRPGIKLKSKAFDIGGQYFEHLYMTEKGYDENGNEIEIKLPGMLHIAKNIGTDENPQWEFYDNKTEKAYKDGILDDNDLKYTWAIANMVRDKYAETIYEKNKYSYVGIDHHLFTKEDAYNKLDDSSFQFGMIPIMDKAMAEMVSSGMIKSAGVRWWEETTNVNALFTESLNEKNRDNNNRLHDRFSSQMSFINRLNMAGLEIDEDGNYRIVDRGLYDKIGFNVEKAAVAFNLSTNRVNTYNDQVMHVYNSANVILTMYEEMGKDQRFVKEALRNMVDRILFNEVRDTEEGGEVKVSKVVDAASKIMTMSQIAGRPLIGIKSLVWNNVQMLITGTANSIANTGHFTLGQAMKAMKYSWTHQELMIKMLREFNMIDRGEWDMLQNPTLIKSESAWWQQYYTSYVNYFADLQARGVAMFAEMMKEGSFGAYSLNDEAQVIYDETKDERLYKNGNITEEGKLLKQAIKKDLIEQGFMTKEDDKLKRGHDIVDANNFKYISDKWIVGAYDNVSKTLATQHYIGRAASKFRLFAVSRLENLGILTPNYKTDMGQKRIIAKDEDGNVIYDADNVPMTKREMIEMEGLLQSYGKMLGYIKHIRTQPNPIVYWKGLNPMTKNNIIRGLTELICYLSLYAICVGFGGGESDEEKRRKKHNKLVWGWVYSDILTISLITDIYNNPIPFLGTADRFLTSTLELITDGKISKNLFNFIPGYGAAKDIDMVAKEIDYYTSIEAEEAD